MDGSTPTCFLFLVWDQLRWGGDLSKLPCWDLFRFLYSFKDFHELRFCWLLDAITWLFIESLPAVSFDYLLTKWELLEFGCLKQTNKEAKLRLLHTLKPFTTCLDLKHHVYTDLTIVLLYNSIAIADVDFGWREELQGHCAKSHGIKKSLIFRWSDRL